MNKRKLHHLWTKLRPLKSTYFLIISILAAGIFVYSYRQADLTMVKLRDAVLLADKENKDIEAPLQELRQYVYSHMGADMTKGDNAVRPPIQLKYEYDRLVAAEKKRVGSGAKNIQSDATRICEARFPAGQFKERVTCVQNYIATHKVEAERSIPRELYQYDFVAPLWSPDITGWSLVVASLFFLLFIIRFSLERWLFKQLKEHS